jgi:hypothetical protein
MKPSKLVHEFDSYWRGLAGGLPPDRGLFDPSAIPHLMPGLLIVELEPDSQRLRYRLVGTLSDDIAGISLTGRYLDEFFGGPTEKSARFFDAIYRRIAVTAQPEEGEYSWPTPDGVQKHIMFGVFPFSVGGAVRQFFYLEDFAEVHSARRQEPWWSRPIENV